MRTAIILLLAWLVPAAAAGQAPADRSERAPKRFSFVMAGGVPLNGPADGLAEQLSRGGFGDTSPGGCFLFFCLDPTAHPSRHDPDLAASLTARFALRPGLTIAAGTALGSLGGADGYREPVADTCEFLCFGDHANSTWEHRTWWAGAFWKPRPWLRVGGGPAWHQLEEASGDPDISRIGLTGEAGVETGVDRRLFLDLALRGYFIPSTDVDHGEITLRPDWSNVTVLVGLGVRL
jgi:hypothetical protein